VEYKIQKLPKSLSYTFRNKIQNDVETIQTYFPRTFTRSYGKVKVGFM